MRKKILLLVASLILAVSAVMAQDVPAGVVAAFKKGNAQELGQFLGENVELIIQNRSSNANKVTTERTMTDFFAHNKVSGFTVNHQGKRDESGFIIGTLITSSGSYRVNCFCKKMQDKYLIHQIRIDKTNE